MNETVRQKLEDLERDIGTVRNRSADTMKRREILDAAIQCVCRDRQDQHGKPENVFQTIAGFWNSYLDKHGHVSDLSAYDVAWMMVLLKVARASANPKNLDNAIDAAGYAALAAELALN